MLSVAILGFVTFERLGELLLARRNTQRLLANGAVEAAPEHYPLIVALHAAWLGGLWLLAWNRPVNLAWLMVFALLQALRAWVLLTLRGRWTTRIIVVPHEELAQKGPYRWIAHPNYVVVIGEIAVLPLAFGLPWFALVFSLLNFGILTIRIRAENEALARRTIEGPISPPER
ncbi:isoprenylcysteine carboxyl methyltransferase family protein [Microvirga flavescens]|uniref:isoprenylcysteine carboxyl methyltransferase family protein n=1 Tax=Microvirga flavescens TaxID=2249811 RepID=UPI000DD556A0|nr:isoprenylcysteine carboxylmethyltransferase family protein [Microvirga flavescens]